MPAILDEFINAAQTQLLFWLIVLNTITGIAGAVKLGKFQVGKMALFYREKVIPYIIGYLGFWFVSKFYVGDMLDPLLGDVAAWAGALVAVANLGDDIRRNLVDMGMPLPGKGSAPDITVSGGVTITPDAGATVSAPSPDPIVVPGVGRRGD